MQYFCLGLSISASSYRVLSRAQKKEFGRALGANVPISQLMMNERFSLVASTIYFSRSEFRSTVARFGSEDEMAIATAETKAI